MVLPQYVPLEKKSPVDFPLLPDNRSLDLRDNPVQLHELLYQMPLQPHHKNGGFNSLFSI